MKLVRVNKAHKVLLVTNSIILLAGAMIGPIYALFVEDIGGDLLDASLAGAVFALAAGITVLVSGRWSDRVKDPELIVVLGYVVIGLGFLSLIWVDSIWTLLVVQAIIGFGEALYSPAYDVVYSQHLDKGSEGREWGLWEAMYYFSTTAGALIGGLIASYYGFTALFVIMMALSFCSALYVYLQPRKLI